MSRRLDWLLKGSDNILTRHRELPALVYPSFQVLAQTLSGDSESVPIDQLVLE